MAEDETLIGGVSGAADDIHEQTALKVFRRPTAPETRTTRRSIAKMINYALLYGKDGVSHCRKTSA